MKNILCRDINGYTHIVPGNKLVKRTSVYGVIRDERGVLLVKDRTASNDKWDLPGGGVESGEDLLDGLNREIHEETGMKIIGEPEEVCNFTEYFYDIESETGWESTRYFYMVRSEGDAGFDGNDDDIVEVRYFTLPIAQAEVSSVAFMVLKTLEKKPKR